MTVPFLQGTITANPLVVPVAKAACPGSYTLVSTDGARKIEFSCDNGVSYFQPTYDQSPAAFITVAALAPVTHARFTSATATDRWTIV